MKFSQFNSIFFEDDFAYFDNIHCSKLLEKERNLSIFKIMALLYLNLVCVCGGGGALLDSDFKFVNKSYV